MEFRILGPLEVVDGHVLRLGSGRQLALVALLLLHRNEAVSVDRLIDELWEGSPPPTAAKIVRNNVSLLRKELGDRLVTRPPGYLLRVEEGELDSELLERAVARGDLESLTDALALWRGRPLAQFAYERFAQEEIVRLEELRLAAVEARIDAQLALGQHAAAIAELEALVQQHPLRERLTGQLMLALYRTGRQADALEAYRRARLRLNELGIEPGPALRELERKILNQDESLAVPPPPSTRPSPPLSDRRLPVALAAAAVVLAVVAGGAFLVLRDTTDGLGEIPANYVGVIDPGRNEIVAALPVGILPGPVAAGGGAIWVGNLQDRSVTRIDSLEREVTGTVAFGDRTPTSLAVGNSVVWVAHALSGELSRIEPRFGRTTGTIRVTSRPLSPTGSVAVGAGFVWAAYGDSTLARIRPAPMKPSGSTLTGSGPTAVVVARGAVWVANSGDATVQRFNPATFEEGPVRTSNVGRQPSGMAYGDGVLWVANRGDDTVTRIDARAGSIDEIIEVGAEPTAVAVDDSGVWVANSRDGTISRIDPDTNEVVRTIRVGNSPAGIAVADGLVWVASQVP